MKRKYLENPFDCSENWPSSLTKSLPVFLICDKPAGKGHPAVRTGSSVTLPPSSSAKLGQNGNSRTVLVSLC